MRNCFFPQERNCFFSRTGLAAFLSGKAKKEAFFQTGPSLASPPKQKQRLRLTSVLPYGSTGTTVSLERPQEKEWVVDAKVCSVLPRCCWSAGVDSWNQQGDCRSADASHHPPRQPSGACVAAGGSPFCDPRRTPVRHQASHAQDCGATLASQGCGATPGPSSQGVQGSHGHGAV